MTTAADIAAKYSLRRRNGRNVGACPQCGGSKKSDKFVLHDDGGFKCYSCGFKGDLITWLRTIEGLSCPEAHQALGKTCTVPGCPVYATCRMGAGNTGERPAYRPTAIQPNLALGQKTLPSATTRTPAEIWQAWAAELVATAYTNLARQPDQQQWLANRGIPAEAVQRHQLGWLTRSSKIQRTDIGLPPNDEKPTLWIPAGLVIPIYAADGSIHRLRIRRTPEERAADHMLKDSFPASDPPSTSGGAATPNDPTRELHREEDQRIEDED